MLSYNEWKLLQESVVPSMTLGLKGKPTVGGIVGSKFQEDFGDDEDDDDDDFGGEDDDEESPDFEDDPDFGGEEGDDDSLPGDLFGASKDTGPKKAFPPDDSQELDGLPTPDVTAGGGEGGSIGPSADQGGDDMATLLGDIDPELAGFDGAGLDGAGIEDMANQEPCPECNPEGAEEQGNPDCQLCGGLGFMGGEEGMGDMGGEMGMGGEEGVPMDGGEGPENMHYMSPVASGLGGAAVGGLMGGPAGALAGGAAGVAGNLLGKGINKVMGGGPSNMRRHMPSFQKKFMSKCSAPMKHMSKGCNCENDDFLATLTRQARGNVGKKFSGGIAEDALLAVNDPNGHFQSEPKAGDVGFAPQGRIGSMGGGYTQDDVKSIPVLGENAFPTLAQYSKKKNRRRR